MTKRELIYIESRYSCANCGQHNDLTVDHIDGREGADANKYDNLIVLCLNCHLRKTTNNGISVKDVKKLKKMFIFNTLTRAGVNALKEAFRKGSFFFKDKFLLHHLVEMHLLKIEKGKFFANSTGATYRFLITEEGKRMYEKWLK